MLRRTGWSTYVFAMFLMSSHRGLQLLKNAWQRVKILEGNRPTFVAKDANEVVTKMDWG